VDQVAGAAKAAQVLRPGGRLAVFGNVFDAPPLVAKALADAYRRVAPDAPFNAPSARTALDIYQEMFAKAADGIPSGGRVRGPRTVALRLEAVLHPRPVAGPAAYHRRPHPVPAGQAGRGAGPRRRRHRRNRRRLHDDLHHAGGHRDRRPNQRHLTRLAVARHDQLMEVRSATCQLPDGQRHGLA
jgi:hypothetical protein